MTTEKIYCGVFTYSYKTNNLEDNSLKKVKEPFGFIGTKDHILQKVLDLMEAKTKNSNVTTFSNFEITFGEVSEEYNLEMKMTLVEKSKPKVNTTEGTLEV